MLKYLSLFSGIGSPEQALKNLGVEFELLGFSEIDKYAIKSYCTVHGVDESLNLGDITKIDIESLPLDIDLITHGSPCQDFSVAGNGKGGDLGSGTRSSLMWNTVAICEHCQPKFVIWENVKNVLSKKHRHNFDKYLEEMDRIGYNNFYQVLNAKNYGVPQNRERIFVVSIRKDLNKDFEFPKGFDNGIRLKDILEDEVDEKYYLSLEKTRGLIEEYKSVAKDNLVVESKVQSIGNVNPSGRGMNGEIYDVNYLSPTLTTNKGEGSKILVKSNKLKFVGEENKLYMVGLLNMKGSEQVRRVYDPEGICPCLNTMQGGNRQPKVIESFKVKQATKKGYDIAYLGDSINLEQPNSTTRRGRVGKQISNTLTTSCNIAAVVKKDNMEYRIRKLTPKEAWRLMGFKDEQFLKAEQVCSNSHLYKQAGNSIVVNVMEEIFKNLI